MGISARIGSNKSKTIRQKMSELNWFIVLVICTVAGFGFAMLYSVAGGSVDPWAKNQFIRFLGGLVLMISIALIDIRVWMFLAYPLYAVALAMLVVVNVMGEMGMGAQPGAQFDAKKEYTNERDAFRVSQHINFAEAAERRLVGMEKKD